MSDCEKCGGKCCKVLLLPIQTREAREFYTQRGLESVGGWAIVPHTCHHLKEGKCTIYDKRPLSCRTMRVDGALCRLIKDVSL